MKLLLNNLFVFLFLVCSPAYCQVFQKEFSIKVSGIKIGKLVWKIQMDETSYSNDLRLKSEGFLSAIYKFEGEYFSEGIIKNKKLKPGTYSHIWKTNKTEKRMKLDFQSDFLILLEQTPYEKERLRLDIFSIKNTKDPLSSFIEIIMGDSGSLVVDGRRIYNMNANLNKKNYETVIEVSNYSNLWADHKRSKFEKIIFEKKEGSFFPFKINIYFDGRIFRLEQN